MHFWPNVGKAKMCLRGVAGSLKNVNKQLKNVNKFSKIEKICHLSNTFWLYQYRVKYAPFQSYSHLKFPFFNWNTLSVLSKAKVVWLIDKLIRSKTFASLLLLQQENYDVYVSGQFTFARYRAEFCYYYIVALLFTISWNFFA